MQNEPESRRGDRQVRLQDPLELEEGLLVEDHMVQVPGREARLAQAVVDGMPREPVVVLHAA